MGLVGFVAACAQQGVPPGGPEDVRPPVVVATFPDTFAIVPDFNGPVRFDFDERISERGAGGALDDAVVISPRTGDVRVKHERRSVIIEIDGGFKPGYVYRVTLLPEVRDLFSNQMRDPFELVFSTGPQPQPTTIAGVVWDRITGRGAANYEVQALPANIGGDQADSAVHLARTDTGGVYAFRFIPDGRYQITAFEDQNRNDTIDASESQGFTRQLIGVGDTLFPANISVLRPDTTPAIITSVEALDSITLLLEFDDFLDPTIPLQNVGVAILLNEDSTEVGLGQARHVHDYVAYAEAVADSFAVLDSIDGVARDAARAAADSLKVEAQRQDSIAAAEAGDVVTDSAAASAVDTAGVIEGVLADSPTRRSAPIGLNGRPQARLQVDSETSQNPASRGLTGPGGEQLPSQQIVAILNMTLVPNTAYQVVVSGVRNIAAIPLGGGGAALVMEPPPAQDSTLADTTAVQDTANITDTLAADSTQVIDTVRVLGLRR